MLKRLLARIFGRKAVVAPEGPAKMPPPPPPHSSKVVVGAPTPPAPPRRLRLVKGGVDDSEDSVAEGSVVEDPVAEPAATAGSTEEPTQDPVPAEAPAPATALAAAEKPEEPTEERAPLAGPRIRLVFDDGSDDEVTDHTPGGMRIRYLADNLLSDGDAR